MSPEIAVIIRSVGERTTDACHFLVCEAVRTLPETPVEIIREIPFSKAVHKGFERGMHHQAKWTLVLDADVLIRQECIRELLAFANRQADTLFVVQGLIFDKIFNILRPAGNHLYRTSHMAKALHCIPEEGSSLRPESTTIDRMVQQGYLFIQQDILAGLHDYEQQPLDIAKKCFIQAQKHGSFVDAIWSQWEKKAVSDPDFRAALLGAGAGKKHQETLYINSTFIEEQLSKVHDASLFPSLPPLDEKSYTAERINTLLETLLAAPDREPMQTAMFPPPRWNHVYGNGEEQ